jgi:hypothetical protein
MTEEFSHEQQSWISGLFVGASLGLLIGVLFDLTEFSFMGIGSCAAAGAIFYAYSHSSALQ